MQRSGSARVYHCDNYKEETSNLKQGRKERKERRIMLKLRGPAEDKRAKDSHGALYPDPSAESESLGARREPL